MSPELIGYADRFSITPGETICFMVSTDLPSYEAALIRLIHADRNPHGPGWKEELVQHPANGEYSGYKQHTYCGSYVAVPHHSAFQRLRQFTLQCWIYPTTPGNNRQQGIISHWEAQSNTGYRLCIDENGYLMLQLGANRQVATLRIDRPLRAAQWYLVAGSYDEELGTARLYQISLQWSPTEPAQLIVEDQFRQALDTPIQAQVLIAAARSEPSDIGNPIGGCLYNGKIEHPRIFDRVLRLEEIDALRQGISPWAVAPGNLLAAWDFAQSSDTTQIIDIGPNSIHAETVNAPTRATTGHTWSGTENHFRHAAHEYGAIHFHDDDLDDARWLVSIEVTLPSDLRSGVYALSLHGAGQKDYIPFFVRPPRGQATAALAFLIPTLTYLAYANERGYKQLNWVEAGLTNRRLTPDPIDSYLAEHPEFGSSLYDRHSDGSGYCYSSRLRPIVNLRPTYIHYLLNAPRHLGADLYMIDWLEQKNFSYDIITDEDLHEEGHALLAPYSAIITGSHPEYWTQAMFLAAEQYLECDGHLLYLGGNGFYWVTSIDQQRPYLIEVRRGVAGTRAWESPPGECYHSTTGELGGLWRHRGRAPNALVGVGFAAQGWDQQTPGYRRTPQSFDPSVLFIFDGVTENEIIGDFGLVMNGAAGDEIDRIDYSLGTPPHTLVLASSTGHSNYYQPSVEDVTIMSSGMGGAQNPQVRADMVYITTAGGAVFSVGSMNWIGSLSHNHYDNNVSRITENVLRHFLR